jgi:hypothetical protein
MILKRISLLAIVMITLIAVSCKKDKTDDSVNGRFQGNWLESSAKQIVLVVSTPPAGDENLPNLRLINGSTTYFFDYRLNSAGDSVYISDLSTGGAKNVPYKITFSGDGKSLTIKKFHTILPNVEPLTFNKQ